ncbi:MucR family transcriptional regulator [Candidatus Uabimicrobium sp. HlEnr_7]|uniref:MucR family transcriptional regulator n=1 Tax=Candidatus Uabimicrobium helgolandensis TaxID=3095367 RepID=UPI0035572E7E
MDNEKVKCLLCGEYFRTISWSHLKYMHGMDCGTYKKKFDLKFITSQALRKHHSSLRVKFTKDMLEKEICKYVENGGSLFNTDVAKEHLHLISAGIRIFGSWKRTVVFFGYKYEIKKVPPPVWTKQKIIDEINNFYNENKHLVNAPSKLKSSAAFHFGSWKNAVEICGLKYNVNRKCKSKEEVLSILQEKYKLGQLLIAGKMKKEDKTLYYLCLSYFKSYKKALASAGIDYAEFRRNSISKWSKEKVIHEIRNIEDYRIDNLPKGLYKASRKLFGVVRPLPRSS